MADIGIGPLEGPITLRIFCDLGRPAHTLLCTAHLAGVRTILMALVIF